MSHHRPSNKQHRQHAAQRLDHARIPCFLPLVPCPAGIRWILSLLPRTQAAPHTTHQSPPPHRPTRTNRIPHSTPASHTARVTTHARSCTFPSPDHDGLVSSALLSIDIHTIHTHLHEVEYLHVSSRGSLTPTCNNMGRIKDGDIKTLKSGSSPRSYNYFRSLLWSSE